MRNDGHSKRLSLAGLALVMTVAAGCGGGEGGDQTAPEPGDSTGAIEVIAVTTGEDLDDNGYALTLGSSAPMALASNGVVTLADLQPDSYELSLDDVAANCQVEGGSSHSVQVTAGDTVEVILAVLCEGSDGTAPRILGLRGPANVKLPGDTGSVTFNWVDPDGDIESLAITIVRNGVLEESGSFDPGYQGQTQGRTAFVIGCLVFDGACLEQPGVTVLGFTLTDAAGNSSNGVEFGYAVVLDAR